jgi:ribose transport system ATP-binding protein
MDEPTSSLTLSETERLLRVIAGLKAEGVSIIFITHRLNEVVQCADRAVVLRDGHMVGALTRAELSPAAMIRLMIGRDLKSLYVPPAAPPGEAVLDIVDAVTDTYPESAVSLQVRRGEILGLAGLIGSGRTELARAIFGVDRLQRGAIRLDGEPIQLTSPRAAIAQGIYLIPEDRKGCGLLLDLSIAENISLPDLTSYLRLWLVDTARETENAKSQRERLKIRAPDVATTAGALSGGNQQKVVLAKWLSMRPKVLIFDEPTRGIDVGAKQEIYDMLRRLTDAGVAVLMISSDMEEVIGVSDRIAVMHEGAISGFLERSQFSEHNVLQLAVGQAV